MANRLGVMQKTQRSIGKNNIDPGLQPSAKNDIQGVLVTAVQGSFDRVTDIGKSQDKNENSR